MRRWTCRCSPALSLLGVAAILLVLAGGFLWMLGGAARIVPDRVGGPFALIDGKGQRVTDGDFRGRYLLIYFGYTSCPDVCPATLANMEAAMRALGPRAARVQPVFITVDPQHDTPKIVASYVANFGADLVGLTGSVDAIRAVQREYRIRSTLHPPSSRSTALIDHTAVLLLVGPDGRYLAPLPADATAAEIAGRLAPVLG